jgi:hypothetical protein
VAVTGDGTRAVTASHDRMAIVWDLATGAPVHTLTGHQDQVTAVAISAALGRSPPARTGRRSAAGWVGGAAGRFGGARGSGTWSRAS